MANYRAYFHVYWDFQETDLKDAYTAAQVIQFGLEDELGCKVKLETVEDTGE